MLNSLVVHRRRSMTGARAWAAALACCALLPACSTVTGAVNSMRGDYVEVNGDDLRQAARAIERAVALGERDAVIANAGVVVVDTPQIQQAVRARAARHDLVSALLDSGHAWEQRNGMLTILRTRAYKNYGTGRDRDRNALLVSGENADRWSIYEGIVEASRFRPKALDTVQIVFHEERLHVMGDGQKFEDEQGREKTIAGVRPKGEGPPGL